MRKTGRWLSAAVAALIAMIVAGVLGKAGADEPINDSEPCFLTDVQRFHERVVSPTEEGDPDYFLRVAEEFISECPDRYEIRDAHLLAAKSALDAGKGGVSKHHFETLMDLGVELDMKERIDYAIALLDQGEDRISAAVQQSAMMTWASDIATSGLADIDPITEFDGLAFRVTYDRVDPNRQITSLWAFDPAGPALPAFVVVRPDYMRAAWRNLRTGGDIGAINVAEFVTCRDRDVIAELPEGRITTETIAAAKSALRDYARAPHAFEDFEEESWVPTCFILTKYLDVPNAATAIMPEIKAEF